MRISSMQIQDLSSLRQAINISNLNKATNQSQDAIDMVKKMAESTKGNYIDLMV